MDSRHHSIASRVSSPYDLPFGARALPLVLLAVLSACAGSPRVALDDADLSSESLAEEGVPTSWRLVWNDEFDAGEIADHWNHEVNAWGGGNSELQYYVDDRRNSYVEGGLLHLVARAESYTGPEGRRDFTSARINTKGNFDFRYGRVDIRARLTSGQGIWPAFWMLPTENAYGGWAASGEVDIMELVGHIPGRVHGTLHYGGEWPNNTHVGDSFRLSNGAKFEDDFHVFTLIWLEDSFRWYVDGEHYQTQTWWRTSGGEFPAPFDQEFHIILNVAVGGNWPGPPDETTPFPRRVEVDWVRVYTPEGDGRE